MNLAVRFLFVPTKALRFHRRAKSYTSTYQWLFQQIEAGEAEISLDKTLQKGIVSIAVSEVALHGLLLPVLEK